MISQLLSALVRLSILTVRLKHHKSISGPFSSEFITTWMKSLADLPPEILRQIFATSYDSLLVVPLLKSGDASLARQLSLCIRSINWELKTLVEFPPLLYLFPKLEHLALRLSKSQSTNFDNELYAILHRIASMNLTSLKLQCSAQSCAFFGPLDASPLSEPTSHFPLQSLTSFALIGCDLSSWTSAHFKSLPPTLTSFTCPGSFSKDFPILSLLPRGLLEWNTMILVALPDFLSNGIPTMWLDPPPSLHSMGMICFWEFIPKAAPPIASHFPKSLTNISFLDLIQKNPQSFIPALPPNVRNVDGGKIDFDEIVQCGADIWSAGWGQKVASLSIIEGEGASLQDELYVYKHLPSSLVKLRIEYMPSELLESQELFYWPPGLTELSIKRRSCIEKCLKAFPATLTRLHLFDLRSAEVHDSFPPALTSLHLSCRLQRNPFESCTFAATAKLPQTLTDLAVYCANTNLKLHPSLPTSLRILIIDNCKHLLSTTTESFKLPRTLVRLSLPEWAASDLNQINWGMMCDLAIQKVVSSPSHPNLNEIVPSGAIIDQDDKLTYKFVV